MTVEEEVVDNDNAKGKPVAATAAAAAAAVASAKPEARSRRARSPRRHSGGQQRGLRDLGPPRASLSLTSPALGDAPDVRPQRRSPATTSCVLAASVANVIRE